MLCNYQDCVMLAKAQTHGIESTDQLIHSHLIFFYKFIYLFIFIFGCVGSSLLHAGFP